MASVLVTILRCLVKGDAVSENNHTYRGRIFCWELCVRLCAKHASQQV